MTLSISVLASGSKGNSIYLESHGRALVIDAGLSARELMRRMALAGADPGKVEGILVSHEHSDHNRGVRALARRLRVPVLATSGTLDRTELADDITCRVIRSGESSGLGPFSVLPFTLPHDAAEPVGFIIESDGIRVGLATDLGYCTALVAERLSGADAIIIESNHDLKMLLDGPYPWFLKQRVKSRMGHLSNASSAAVLADLTHPDLQHVILAHLSEVNNDPDLAGRTAREADGIRTNGTGVWVSQAAEPLGTVIVEK